jgi:hypothetical protein
LLSFFFDPEDGGDVFLRNVSWHSTDYTALYPRRWYSPQHPVRKHPVLFAQRERPSFTLRQRIDENDG